MINCPTCATENDDSARFCAKCGARLAAFVDFYALLNLAPDAPQDKIEAALREAARVEPSPLTPKQLDEAIDILREPGKRAKYDRERIIQLAQQQSKKAKLASENFYQRLGVSRYARRRDIQTAFDLLQSLASQGKISPGGLRRLEQAHRALTDPARRRAYDQRLNAAVNADAVPVPHEFNFYDYLGLDRNATEPQIRKADEALRGPLTLKAKTGDQSAEVTLRQLNQIIQTLTDAEKRKEYDTDSAHDVFRFQTPGRLAPTTRAARFAVIENIVYGSEADGLCAFGGLWQTDLRR